MITACAVFCFTIFPCLLKASFVRLYTKKWILNFIHRVFITKYKGSFNKHLYFRPGKIFKSPRQKALNSPNIVYRYFS